MKCSRVRRLRNFISLKQSWCYTDDYALSTAIALSKCHHSSATSSFFSTIIAATTATTTRCSIKCSSIRNLMTIQAQNNIAQKGTLRFFSQSTSHDPPKLRVAIIGGGASGLSAALHLAPLVSKGLIAKPIHVYEKSSLEQQDSHIQKTNNGEQNDVHHPNDVNFTTGTGVFGRDIGVGIWNTALEPFKKTHGRKSHLQLIEQLEEMGQYVGEVGYRTPKGKWLTKSKLRTEQIQASDLVDDTVPCIHPSLLFVRERDFLSCLRQAVQVEQDTFGTIQMHHGRFKNDKSTCVQDVVLCDNHDASMSMAHNGSIPVNGLSGKLEFADGTLSDQSYHFIIAADGMNSTLRTKYAGYDTFIQRWKSGNEAVSIDSDQWQREQMQEKYAIEDRNYVVFRGNSPLTNEQANMNGRSFQTWGEGRNMRFAAVGMSHPKSNNNESKHAGERCEKQVWFATIHDDELCSIKDPQKRKERLIENFKNWHEPICSLIDSTPADDILMERGLGHKHSLLPVLNLAEVIQYQTRSKTGNGSSTSRIMPYQLGSGPIILFSGDAYMTIDPVLAQGFTMGMEDAADLASTLEKCLQIESIPNSDKNHDATGSSWNRQVAFDPTVLRKAILERNTRRFERVMCLIRSTELVQYMAQPTSLWGSMLVKHILRPCMLIIPSSIKEVAFSVVMKYSLGYYCREGNKLDSSKTRRK